MATPALDGLAQREQAIEAARRRVAELEAKVRDGSRALDLALAAFQEHHRSVEAGEVDSDPEREAELREAVRSARRSLTPQAVRNQRGEIGGGGGVELIDPKIKGQLAGARQRVQEADADYDRYLRIRFDDLEEELVELGADLTRRFERIVPHIRKAQREWNALQEEWRPLVDLSDLTWADFPRSPFSGIEDVPVLMPKQLAEGGSIGGFRRPRMRSKRRS